LSDAYALTEIPQFHGIPKIHKKPWGLCPIVPSHSWISSPAVKIVSLYLKPIYKHLPWIIQSTKEFVSILDKITIDSNEKIFLCTGDVTAMYTNINKDSAHVTLKSMFGSLELSDGKVDALLQAIDLANNHNYVEFDGRFFHQEKGLAMGTTCSPDIANLYLGNGEHNRKIPFRKGILSYAQYIDDIFMIVQANSEEDARLLCPDHIGPLKLLWEVSDTRIHFLDVEVFKMLGAIMIVSKTRAAQRLISSRMVLAFSRTTSFGDMVNSWNKDLLLVDPSIELADRPEELEIMVSPITSGVGPKEFYGK
jgi:hypothetical protein